MEAKTPKISISKWIRIISIFRQQSLQKPDLSRITIREETRKSLGSSKQSNVSKAFNKAAKVMQTVKLPGEVLN